MLVITCIVDIMAEEEFIDEYEEAECPTCGAIVPVDATECTECGQKFEEEDEEELWEDEEEEELLEDEEPTDDWEGYWEDTAPSKMKLYLGVVILFSGTIVAFLSWFHNQLEWNPLNLENYAPNIYGPYDQIAGGSGSITTIIGIVLIFLYLREVKAHQASKEIPEEVMLSETDYFTEQPENNHVEEEFEELPEEEISEIECPECGEVNAITAPECWNCGFMFEELEMDESEEDYPEEEEAETEEIRCPNCGSKNDPAADFCSNCEQDLSGSTEIWGESEDEDMVDDEDLEDMDEEMPETEYSEDEDMDEEMPETEYSEDEDMDEELDDEDMDEEEV